MICELEKMNKKILQFSILLLATTLLHAVTEKGYILNQSTSPTTSSVSIINTLITPPTFISRDRYNTSMISGSTPCSQAIAITPNGLKVYVANNNSNQISVISTETAMALPSITLRGVRSSSTWINSVAVTPDGTKAYITNGNSNSVHIIDTATDTELSNSPIALTNASFPMAVAINSDGYVFITNLNLSGPNNYINVIDSSTDQQLTPIISGITRGSAIAINSQGHAYITSNDTNSICVLNTNTRSVIGTISITSALSAGAVGIAITSNDIAYISNNSNRINVVNTLTNTQTATLSLNSTPTRPFAIAISPSTGYVYITNIGSSSISVIDSSNNTEISGSPFSAGTFNTSNPCGIAIIQPYTPPTPTPIPSVKTPARDLVRSLQYSPFRLQNGAVIP